MIGKVKAYYQRLITYVTALNFLMIFYNFQLNNDWFPWYVWLIIFFVVMLTVHYVDKQFIWEDEATTAASKNRVLMENNHMLKLLLEGEKKRND